MDQKGRILVVDDDDLFSSFVEGLLSDNEYSCITATNATDATGILSRDSVDLVIADINMPGNVNLEFVHDLPRIAPGVPVIIVTGDPTVDTAIQAVRLSVGNYLVKPFDPQELLTQVKELVNRHHIFVAVQEAQDRLNDWSKDLNNIQQSLERPFSSEDADLSRVMILTTLRNVTNAVLDLEKVVDVFSSENRDSDVLKQVFDMPKLDEFRAVLEDTIGVLEKTKSSFKSKEIGQLRRRLQAVLEKDSSGGSTN